MKNKKWFTLLEVLLSVMILSIFIGTILTIFLNVKWADWKIINKRTLIAEASDLIDRIHEAALYYTIDYEEYFNRRWLWYWVENTWFSTYWNSGNIYYCVKTATTSNIPISERDNTNYWCLNKESTDPFQTTYWQNQKYLEYYFQHRFINNRKGNPKKNDIDDSNIWFFWYWPIAIEPNTWLDFLYLINWEWTERYYFRRLYITWIDLDWNWDMLWKNEKLYKIQMLILKGFDAWTWHDYYTWWAYDWFIDTRACDSTQGFYCEWHEVLAWYNLPKDADDWRIDITNDNVTVSDMKISIYPQKDPYLSFNEPSYKIDPYAKISFTMNIYWKELDDEITITTTLTFKNSYRRFPTIQYTWYQSVNDFSS